MCPLLGKDCVEHRCKFWIHEEWVNTQTGERRVGFECLFVLHYQLARQAVVETIRCQASSDKVATVVHEGFAGLMELAHQARALNG
jgi:hypothetical protein